MRDTVSQALVADGRGSVALTCTTVEEPGPSEVVVQIRAAGLCHTDYDSTLEKRQPYVLGHEGAGEVLSVGDDVVDLKIGQPVLLTWAIACGKCFQCIRGNAVHCEVLGRTHGHAHYGSTRANGSALARFFHLGTMANVAVVRREALVPLPESIPFDVAAILGCGVMTGFGSVVNAARVPPGATVTVIGCGGVGLNVIQGARIAGASQIVAVDVQPEKLSRATKMGATQTLVASPEDRGLIIAAAAVRSRFEGRGTDYAFECTAVPDLAFAPLAMVRDGGTAVQVSGVEQKVLGDLQLFEWDKTYINPLYGKCQPDIDFPRLFALYEAGALDLESMITRRYSLDEHATAFDDLKNSRTARRCSSLNDLDFLSFEYSGNQAGVVQEITVFSQALGRRADISVYASSTAPPGPIPLVVLLHGVYGSHWSWSRLGRAPQITEALVGAGAIRDCIVAMPSDGLSGLGSGYVANGLENAERWIVEEVPAAAQRLYPGAGKCGIAIAGLSMGGLGALNLMANHPRSYLGAAALSPLLDAVGLGRFTGYPQHGPPPASITTDSLLIHLSALRGSTPRLWLGCGCDDPLLASTRSFHARLESAGIGHSYVEAAGDHQWSYWTAQLEGILMFFDSLFP